MEINDILNMYFEIIEDTRDQFTVKHKLIDILKLIMIAVLCGMDELDKIVNYGNNKKDFLEKEFNITSIPSKSTLTRILVMIDPKWLGLSIVGIVQSLINEKTKQIMFDGKAIKSTDAIKSIKEMMNIVTAYADTGISLLQKTVEEKTNEIPAVMLLIARQFSSITVDKLYLFRSLTFAKKGMIKLEIAILAVKFLGTALIILSIGFVFCFLAFMSYNTYVKYQDKNKKIEVRAENSNHKQFR